MRLRTFRSPALAVAVVTGVVGALAWAPSAAAETASPSPVPTSGTAPRDTIDPVAETGGIRILKKDPDGALLSGAAFALLDSTGNQVGAEATDAAGLLAFQDLDAGVYRLKETSSGSPLHDTVADQDIIVPPRTTVPLTIVDPFKPANLTVKKTDRGSGKPLAGAIINITPQSGGRTLTLTTGKDGTAQVALPVNTRTGTPYTATETRAPGGYHLNPKPVKITAKPGAPLVLTHTSVKKTAPTTPPATPPHTTPPATRPPATTAPSPSATATGATAPKPSQKTNTTATSATAGSAAADTSHATGRPMEKGQLARTGSAAPWLLGGTVLLLATGAGTVIAVRRRRPNNQGDHAAETGQD
ncbi:SpaA isopeptide-forming pilin-related protein [Streptomyces sp. NPDC059076]|uniref:SpaA isopeptide-forming pilin-related protein n=1 Tax=unclassified Streptomyces TaxID=2593676 RepID=UPI003687A535